VAKDKFFSDVTNCYATSTVAATGANDYIGGLCGRAIDATISGSYATGATSGDDFIGGLVGNSNDCIITNCFAIGAASGDTSVGGLIGHNETSTITTCHATGAVTGTTSAGGLVATEAGAAPTVTNSYWNATTTGQATSAGSADACGLTTGEYADKAEFIGFDWKTWRMTTTQPELQTFNPINKQGAMMNVSNPFVPLGCVDKAG